MTKPADDLEAIRLVIQALEPFDSKDRERIIRWAAEKLGMTPPSASLSHIISQAGVTQTPAAGVVPKDIRSFVMAKNPKTDNQMAAVVAYYYHFEAPATERKDSIGKEELIDACRKSDRKRPARPEQVLVNTYAAGLLDKAGSSGKYRLNSVGENLVAMVLPEQDSSGKKVSGKKLPRKAKDTGAKRSSGKKIKGRSVANKSR